MVMTPEMTAAVMQLIAENDAKFRADINVLIAGDGKKAKTAIEEHRGEMFTHRATFIDQEARINTSITEQNLKNESIVAKIKTVQQVIEGPAEEVRPGA